MRKLLTIGKCPIHDCHKPIYDFDQNGRPRGLNNDGMLFWVKFNDGGDAQFSICKSCFNRLDPQKIDDLMNDQIYTWGMEIMNAPLGIVQMYKQWTWYISVAVFLKIDSWAREKDGLSA